MNTLRYLFIALFLPACLWAETPEQLVQRLIADAWSPQTVRVEWKFTSKVPADLARWHDWTLADPRPTRLAGTMILALDRKDSNTTRKAIVTGTARIFGPSVMVKQAVASGQRVEISNLDSSEGEWTNLNGDAAQMSEFSIPKIALRALIPGRAILMRDIKGDKLIHRGQTVAVEYADGSVRVRIAGRALCDGSVGDMVAVSTDLVSSRRLSGTVNPDGTVELVR